MQVYIGSDHGGYAMKEVLKGWMDENGQDYTDLGCFSEESVDYPDFAKEVCEKVIERPDSLGVLICGTGIGISMAANKFPGIRAALCTNENMAQMAKEHNNAQVLCLGGRITEDDMAKRILEKFLKTEFSNEERHKRRIDKIESK